MYPETDTASTPLGTLPRGRTVAVLGRTDGEARRAWCRITWEGASQAWVGCSAVSFIIGSPETLPISGPARSVAPGESFPPSAVPANPPVYSYAEVATLLEQCRVTIYVMSRGYPFHGVVQTDSVNLSDGTYASIAPASPGSYEVSRLLPTNVQRCGFAVLIAQP